MGKVVATYLVKVTLRDPVDRDAVSAADNVAPEPPPAPTNDLIAEAIEEAVAEFGFEVKATSERTDR